MRTSSRLYTGLLSCLGTRERSGLRGIWTVTTSLVGRGGCFGGSIRGLASFCLWAGRLARSYLPVLIVCYVGSEGTRPDTRNEVCVGVSGPGRQSWYSRRCRGAKDCIHVHLLVRSSCWYLWLWREANNASRVVNVDGSPGEQVDIKLDNVHSAPLPPSCDVCLETQGRVGKLITATEIEVAGWLTSNCTMQGSVDGSLTNEGEQSRLLYGIGIRRSQVGGG
ncbi:hypothetical protein GE09DRAFT_297348 [Coniochaeta sp. 2T2.1]|nr:hypothetical protein GE09DRAFT_297348 [Coniochaeta sp. 2T2.1]